jgi:hypothetical protein
MYIPRNLFANLQELPHQPATTPIGNQLTDGTLIDLGGVILIFQSPIQMIKIQNHSAEGMIQKLNQARPQCPVQLHDIQFSFLSAKERAKRVSEKLFEENHYYHSSANNGVQSPGTLSPQVTQGLLTDHSATASSNSAQSIDSYYYGHLFNLWNMSPTYHHPHLNLRYGPVHIPSVDYSHIPEEHRSYVFPTCGHVHAYHKSLESKPCPLCRTVGSFVPLAFAFEPAICSDIPTHVFNSCGHVASYETCAYWSSISVLYRTWPALEYGPICPFCGKELDVTKPFSKLIIQTENGTPWELAVTSNELSSNDNLDTASENASSTIANSVYDDTEAIIQAQRCLFTQQQQSQGSHLSIPLQKNISKVCLSGSISQQENHVSNHNENLNNLRNTVSIKSYQLGNRYPVYAPQLSEK